MNDPDARMVSQEELAAMPTGCPTYVLFENATAESHERQRKQQRRKLELLRSGVETDDPDVRDGFVADMSADDVSIRKGERVSDEWAVHCAEVAVERLHRQALRCLAGAGLFGPHWTHERPLPGRQL
jgi:hypothetical protein